MNNESYKHIRINPETGAKEYFYPMEIRNADIRELAREQGLEIVRTRLGFRVFDAIMVPCKESVRKNGRDTFVPTPEERQRNIYLSYIRDELNEQDRIKQDGRCLIPDGQGGMKRCPLRIDNPNYSPENGEPKTLRVNCEGCLYENYKESQTYIELSSLDHKAEDGQIESFETNIPKVYSEADRYDRAVKQLLEYIKQADPMLADLARLLLEERSRSESARILGQARSTAGDYVNKIRELANKFLDSTII